MNGASYWRDWQGMSPAARLLIINGLAFNLGFYMMLPFLAQHMGSGLGLAGWACGLVMGMRVFSQQGLFLLGGTLGDRIGYHPAIVWGCLVRSVGFLLLGWAESLPILLLAAALTGFAGALFTPCAQAYLASECSTPSQRQRAFALHNLASQAGMLLGPLVGLTLTQQSYALTGLLAASLFALLALVALGRRQAALAALAVIGWRVTSRFRKAGGCDPAQAPGQTRATRHRAGTRLIRIDAWPIAVGAGRTPIMALR